MYFILTVWSGILLVVSILYKPGLRVGLIPVLLLLPVFGLCLINVPSIIFSIAVITVVSCGIGFKLSPKAHAASLLVVGMFGAGLYVWSAYRTHQRHRETYPFESMENRLAYERDAVSDSKPISPEALSSTEELERTLNNHPLMNYETTRTAALRVIHDTTVNEFTQAEGFGIGRGPFNRGIYKLRDDKIDNWVTSRWEQEKSYPILSHGVPPKPSQDKLRELHLWGVLEFVNRPGYGLIRGRDKVASFQEHYFRDIPTQSFSFAAEADYWKLTRLDLVSLLKHETPRAYVSDELPRMDKLRKAPTRPLDDFESRTLEELRKGATLRTRSDEREIRMLGSIRAANQCLQCHNVERGRLLGAFSYILRPVDPSEEK